MPLISGIFLSDTPNREVDLGLGDYIYIAYYLLLEVGKILAIIRSFRKTDNDADILKLK